MNPVDGNHQFCKFPNSCIKKLMFRKHPIEEKKMSSYKPITSPSFFIGKGNDSLISFGSGQPDLPPPQEVFDMLHKYKSFKYGLVQGQVNLREALSSQYPDSTPESFVITNGASEAIDLTFRVLANRGGKKVLLPRPYYYSYPYNVEFAGMEPVYYDLVDGKINLENFKANLDGCCAILINSPSNPTGSVQDLAVLKQIETIASEKSIYIVSDEVYKDLIYDRENYLFSGDNIITINSFSKTFAMCGFRVGYLWSTDSELINECVDMKTHTSMNTNILGQEMAYVATRAPKEYIQEQVVVWKQRRDLIYSGLKSLGLDLWKPEGAFYVFPKFNAENSNQVVSDLYYKHQMITYDGTWFGAPGRVRFSYALDVNKIEIGLSRLKEYLQKG